MAALGFRHGFDWDHIAAITDITSTTTAGHAEVDVPAASPVTPHGHDAGEMRGHVHEHAASGPGAMHAFGESRFAHEQRHAVGLASLYALGHASVVLVLGVLALTLGAVLPDWVDPILEKVVGVTLVLLGVWVIYSVVQYLRGKSDFRLRSRWMLVFVVGLRLSNTLVAVVSASGFIGAQRMRTLYVIVGGFAGVASLVIGGLFIVGLGTVLPDLQQLLFGGGT